MKNKQGFTLIELLLYVAIVSIVLTSLVQFAWVMINNSSKNTTQQEVYSVARITSERIKYEIRNATGINSVSSSQISLATGISATNPTVISFSGGNLTIQQGIGSTFNLNSANTSINTLTFTNYSSADNKSKQIGVNFTLKSNFNSVRQEYQETLAVETSAEVRNN